MRYFTLLLILLLTSTVVLAQDDIDPGKALKKAERNVSSYNLDPANNLDKLEEARELIAIVMESEEHAKDPKAWQAYGTVYTETLNSEVMTLVNDMSAPIMHKDAPQKIYEGYSKAYEYAEKNYQLRDASKGLNGIMNNMAYLASVLLKNGDFQAAGDAYDALVKSHDFLTEKGEESIYTSQDEVQQQVYWAALSAFSANDLDAANKYFTRLYEEGYDSPDVYSGLYEVKTRMGETEMADKILTEGAERYPDDKGLMYAEINKALAEGKLESLITKLEKAMETEPDNVTIPSTLGNVYDQLYQKAVEQGDMEKAEEYYEKAKEAFNKALTIDPEYFDAMYMLGLVEYNKAAVIANEVNALAEDYSKEGTKKYEAKKAEMMQQFDLALPYFIDAEKLNPTDINTLIALREIYARKDMLEKSQEYKDKIEKAQMNQD